MIVAPFAKPGRRALIWISAPAGLTGDLQARKSAADSGSPAIDQLALASLLTAGEYERHVVRARHAYRRRRDLLLHALTARFPKLQVSGAAAGILLLLPLPGQTDDTALAQAAAACGVGVAALSPLHLARSPDPGLLLGVGRLPEHKIPLAVDALCSVLTQIGAASSPSHHRPHS
jgi:GntR family transcriptional regulator / MocR family aminotransferase